MVSILHEATMATCVNSYIRKLYRKTNRKDMLRIAHNSCSKYFLDKHIQTRIDKNKEQGAKELA